MRRNPVYVFKDRSSTGISNVPLKSTIHILDDGSGPRYVEIIDKSGLNAGSTVGDFLNNPSLYIDLTSLGEIPSELEKITENGQVGWRILGRDPEKYGDIGQEAIDLSLSDQSTNINGAVGFNSFAVGKNTKASGTSSSAFGEGTSASNTYETVVGAYNTDSNQSEIFVVGIGTNDFQKKDGLVVLKTGEVVAPEMGLTLYDNTSDPKILVTKEYADDIDGGSIS